MTHEQIIDTIRKILKNRRLGSYRADIEQELYLFALRLNHRDLKEVEKLKLFYTTGRKRLFTLFYYFKTAVKSSKFLSGREWNEGERVYEEPVLSRLLVSEFAERLTYLETQYLRLKMDGHRMEKIYGLLGVSRIKMYRMVDKIKVKYSDYKLKGD